MWSSRLRNTRTLPVCRIPTGPVCWNLIFSLALILTSYEGWTTHSVSLDLFLYLVNEKFAFSIKVPWLLETCLSFISLASEAQSVSSTSLGPLVKVYTKVLRKPQNRQTSAVVTRIPFAASSLGHVSSLSPFVLKKTWPLGEIPKILASTKGDKRAVCAREWSWCKWQSHLQVLAKEVG